MENLKRSDAQIQNTNTFQATPALVKEAVLNQVGINSKPKKILVVDDEVINRMVAKSLLEDLGYEVDLADCGTKGLAMYHADYCAVILDIGMPDIKGYEVSLKIRERENHYQRVPIIAATAYTLSEVQDQCFASGMDEVLSKPIAFEELKNTLGKWVQLSPRFQTQRST